MHKMLLRFACAKGSVVSCRGYLYITSGSASSRAQLLRIQTTVLM